jgi:hypothetical protein
MGSTGSRQITLTILTRLVPLPTGSKVAAAFEVIGRWLSPDLLDASPYTEVVKTLVDALEAGVIRASVVGDNRGIQSHRSYTNSMM